MQSMYCDIAGIYNGSALKKSTITAYCVMKYN